MDSMTEKNQSPNTKTVEKLAELLLFCPCCFASSEGGSWTKGQAVFEGLCINCGASGPALTIPRWAVESIHRQASWVGKRYYPNDEDKETWDEVQALRATIKEFPGRSVRRTEDGKDWWVSQRLKKGQSISIVVKAKTWEDAFEKARLQLPYVPKP